MCVHVYSLAVPAGTISLSSSLKKSDGIRIGLGARGAVDVIRHICYVACDFVQLWRLDGLENTGETAAVPGGCLFAASHVVGQPTHRHDAPARCARGREDSLARQTFLHAQYSVKMCTRYLVFQVNFADTRVFVLHIFSVDGARKGLC